MKRMCFSFVFFCVVLISMTHAVVWEVEYNCDVLPEKAGWEINDDPNGCGESEIVNGTLFWDTAGCLKFYELYEEWDMEAGSGAVLELSLKIERSDWADSVGAGIKLVIGLGANGELISFAPDKVCFNNSHNYIKWDQVPPYEMDTTDQFHTYRIAKVEDDIWVWLVDDPRNPELILNGENQCKSGYTFNKIGIGDVSSGVAGSCYLDFVRYTSGTEAPFSVAPKGKLATTWGALRTSYRYTVLCN